MAILVVSGIVAGVAFHTYRLVYQSGWNDAMSSIAAKNEAGRKLAREVITDVNSCFDMGVIGMSRRASVSLLVLSFVLVACQTKPVTIEGECRLFEDPGFAVRGETPRDQRWISKTQEVGIRACGWGRPTD